MHYVGVDIAKKKFDVTLLKEDGGKRRKSLKNNQTGFEKLSKWLKSQVGEANIHICMESTSVYWEELAEYMHGIGYVVSVVNPSRIKGYAMSQMRRSKTDPLDGDVIADFCRTQQPKSWAPPDAAAKKLRALVRHRQSLLKSQNQYENRLETCHDDEVRDSLQEILSTILTQIEQVEARITQFFEDHPDLKAKKKLLESIKGIGDVSSTYILAEMYDIEQYESAQAAAADAGVTPSHYESGKSVRKRPRMSRMGKASIRSILHFPAITAIRYNPLVAALAKRLKQRGKHPAAIRVAAMRKLIHIAYGVLKNKRPFDPAYTG